MFLLDKGPMNALNLGLGLKSIPIEEINVAGAKKLEAGMPKIWSSIELYPA
jgi:hypothetical protein